MMFRDNDFGFAAPAPPSASTWRCVSAVHRGAAGAHERRLDVAEETPLAIAYNGIDYAVMMGTPRDLEDFAFGFSIAETVAVRASDIRSVATTEREDSIAVDITLTSEALHRFLARRRVRALRGHTSCGICGIEDVAQLTPPIAPPMIRAQPIDRAALRRAVESLRGLQPLSEHTHCAHAAAWADQTGAPILVREDVGRHNALDKLVGAALRAGIDFAAGFCLITSRCSYEMAQKAVAAGIPALVAISAPTALAVRTARAGGLTLIVPDRADGFFIYASPDGETVLT
jgi:FdhD protein